MPLCDVFNVAGTSWLTDTEIVFAQTGANGGLYHVSAAGGQPERIAAPDQGKGEQDYAWPDAVPGGQAVLFTIRRSQAGITQAHIAVRSVVTGEQKILIEGGSYPRYAATGHLVYAQAGTLMAIQFDPDRLEVAGSPVPAQEGVVTKGDGVANYSFAGDGSLVDHLYRAARSHIEVGSSGRTATEGRWPLQRVTNWIIRGTRVLLRMVAGWLRRLAPAMRGAWV